MSFLRDLITFSLVFDNFIVVNLIIHGFSNVSLCTSHKNGYFSSV